VSKGQQAQAGYQPAYQGQADQGYFGGAQSMAAGGQTLQGQVVPAYGSTTNAVFNNPYYGTAQQGANDTASIASQYVAPMQLGGGVSLYGGAGQSGQIASNVMAMQPGMANAYRTDANPYATDASPYSTSTAATSAGLMSGLPAATGGYGLANGAYGTAVGAIPQYSQGGSLAPAVIGGTANMMGQTTGGMPYAGAVMGSAFDPQGALYNRTMAQTLDQQKALSAQNGVAGSPFAAGLEGDAARNFNIDWQNQQLQRQIAGLGAYNQTASTAAGNYAELQNSGVGAYDALMSGDVGRLTSLLSTGANAYTGLTNSATQGLTSILNSVQGNQLAANGQNFNQMLGANSQNFNQQLGANSQNFNQGQTAWNGAIANYGQLQNTALNQYMGASDLGAAGLNNLYSASQLPSQTYLGQQQSNFDALNQQTAGTNSAYGLTQQATADYGQYMNIGQGATKLQQSAAQANNAQSAAFMSGVGKLVGTVAGVALAPFTGGASLTLAAAAQGA
jgi:hypothetical protein